VARVRRNVWGNSDVGMLVQRRAATDTSLEANVSYGVDANLRPMTSLVINAYAAASRAAGDSADGTAGRVSVAYRDAFWNASAMVKRVSDGFDPGIGFVRRRGMEQRYATLGVHARPAWRGVSEVAPFVEVDDVRDLAGTLDSRTVTAGVQFQFRPDGELEIDLKDEFDRLDAAFAVFPGRTIAAGAYAWREASARWTTTRRWPVYATFTGSTGGFYDGTRTSYGGTVTWRARYDFSVEATYTRNDVELPSGPFLADVGRLRVRYARSTRLFGSAAVQYNAQTNTVVTNARVNYRWAPLSDIFVVFTDRRNPESGVLGERTVALKVTRMLAF
jgi:hypothetical protein